jgi:hypothetical protein
MSQYLAAAAAAAAAAYGALNGVVTGGASIPITFSFNP